MKTPLVELPIATRDGQFVARYSEKGLAELNFPADGRDGLPLAASGHRSSACPYQNPPLASRNRGCVEGGSRRARGEIAASARLVRQNGIPTGGLARAAENGFPKPAKSYGEIARAIDKPKAVRAVGGACGANPIPVLVPCHRVLAANGKIGGFSGGLDRKRDLLAREGILFVTKTVNFLCTHL